MTAYKHTVFLGDSLTQWGNWDILFPDKNIVNHGIAGDKTHDILMRIKNIKSPGKVFFMAGINDLGDNISLNTICANYNEILNVLFKNFTHIQVYLLSILPVNFKQLNKPSITPENIYYLNNFLKKISDQSNAIFINIAPSFSDNYGNLNPLYTNDGLHLNNEGYQVWKKEINEYLN